MDFSAVKNLTGVYSMSNMRAASLGRTFSAEHRANMSAAKLGNTSRVKTYDIIILAPDGLQYGPINNIAAFAREHGLDQSNMHKVVSGKLKTHKGWRLFEAL